MSLGSRLPVCGRHSLGRRCFNCRAAWRVVSDNSPPQNSILVSILVCLLFHARSIATGGENFFGGADVRLEDVPKKLELEQQAEHEMFVVIADLWLDRPECVANFRAVMEGFESVPNVPSHFILMGNFTSAPVSAVSGDLRQIAGGCGWASSLYETE